MSAIAVLHKEEILKRVAKSDKIADIGGSYGVSHAAKYVDGRFLIFKSFFKMSNCLHEATPS